MFQVEDRFMRAALGEARKGLGRTSPNPAVGAVIVREGHIIAKGWHRGAGKPHAEVEALQRLENGHPEDTLYVTLEPCHHFGRTPPCTDAILKSGIGRVVAGMADPNPHVRGGGCAFLEKQGLLVRLGVLEEECRQLNEDFFHFVATGRPFVMAKTAMTLDGWTATASGHSTWVTGPEARHYVHRLRNRVDAIMTGIGTVLADNPALTTRLPRGRGRDPIRIIVDTHLKTPLEARVIAQESPSKTILAVGSDVSEEKLTRMTSHKGVSLLVCPSREGRMDLPLLLDRLGEMSIQSLLVEGGSAIMGSLIRERLVDKFYCFKAPKLLGGGDGYPMATGPGASRMDECLPLKNVHVRKVGGDILITGYPDYGKRA